MAVTIESGQNLTPNAFQDVQTVTGMTTTTATSEAHGQTIDLGKEITVLAGGTESRVANVYQMASGREGQEKWITLASATGASMIALTVFPDGTFTATTALVLNDANDVVALKFVNNSWLVTQNVGATAATASSPFA